MFALGGFVLGIFLALKSIRRAAPAPVEWLASAGLFLILISLLPESDPDPALTAVIGRTICTA
jgi:hypothetical protein